MQSQQAQREELHAKEEREKDTFTSGFVEPLSSMVTIACNNNKTSTTSESNT
jgi:hypothetical protein